jgi:hypothetical protein
MKQLVLTTTPPDLSPYMTDDVVLVECDDGEIVFVEGAKWDGIYATVTRGFKRTPSGFEVETKPGFPIDVPCMNGGMLLPGSLLTPSMFKKPRGVKWPEWLSIHLRNRGIIIRTTAQESLLSATLSKSNFVANQETHLKMSKVSIITPTYNRHQFLPRLIACIDAQEGEFNRSTGNSMEWCILDDSPEPLGAEQQQAWWGKAHFKVMYVHLPEKVCVGNKRNILARLATGRVYVNFDDDDLHHPERCKVSLHKLHQSKLPVVGCTRCLLGHKGIIYQINGFGNYHSTAGLMAFTREHTYTHQFGEDIPNAEEGEFTNGYKNPLAQLNPYKVILIMCHDANTYDKTAYIEKNKGKMLSATKLKTKNFTKNKRLLSLFQKSY